MDDLMKRIDLIRHLEQQGCEPYREGSRRSVYINRLGKNIVSCPPASRD